LARRIAITGANGFIGSHVIEALRGKGLQPVILLRRHPGALLRPGFDLEVVLGDLGDRKSLERLVRGADAIVHLAGAVKALGRTAFFEANAMGTERLLVAAANINPTAPFIHISSIAAREPALSPYAASKRAAEERVANLAGQRPWLIIRPPAVYGPGDFELLPLFRCARYGVLPIPSPRSARFSLIHVKDLADAIAALVASEWVGNPVIEIDDGAPNGHDWPEIVTLMQQMAQRSIKALFVPKPAMIPLAIASELAGRISGKPAMLTHWKLRELFHPDWVARSDDKKIPTEWRPKFNLEAGFLDTWNWYLSSGFLT